MSLSFYKDIRPEDIPVPNKQAIQLIQYALKDDAKIETLTQLISLNPALTAQLMGLVNSSFFGFREEIRLISDAIVAVGMDSLRNLVLCFSIKDTFLQKPIKGFDSDAFWEDSIRRAVAAQQLGYMIDIPVEEAFTAGMLLDIGLLVQFLVEPGKVDRWPLLRSNIPQQRHEMEKELFNTTHDGTGVLLATKWNLPKSYIHAIGYHHLLFDKKEINKFGKNKHHVVMAGMMHLSDLCNAIYTCHDKAGALTDFKKKAKILFSLTDEAIESLLSTLPDKVKEISNALHMSVGPQADFEDIVELANRKLLKDNISYQELTWQLQNSLKQRDEYSAQLGDELEKGKQLQKDFLPHQLLGVKNCDISSYFHSALQLSGDFYDMFKLPGNYIGFAIGDVSGKGVGSALFMALTRSLLRVFSSSFTTANFMGDLGNVNDKFLPKDALKAVPLINAYLSKEHVDEGMFVTLFFYVIDPLTGKIFFINGGHEPVFIVGKHGIKKSLTAVGPALGPIQGANYKIGTSQLETGDILFGYTDGVTEARSETKQLYTRARLEKILNKGHAGSAENFLAMIKTDLLKFTKNAPQSDDITMLAVKWEPGTIST